MRVDTTLHVPRQSLSSAYLDGLQMLTGAGLILFLWAHMILVASVIFGPGAMNTLAHFFEATYLAQVGGPLIALVMILHFLLAARKMPFVNREQKVFWTHAKMMQHKDTWLWLVQVVSALVILIMGCTHMWVVLTDLPITAAKSAVRIQGGYWLVFYLILLPMAELHVGIGFYRIGVKWGFIRKNTRKKMQRAEYYLTGIFILIGFITLMRFLFLSI